MARSRRYGLNATELLARPELQSKQRRRVNNNPAPIPTTRRYTRVTKKDLRLVVTLRWGTEDPNFDTPSQMGIT